MSWETTFEKSSFRGIRFNIIDDGRSFKRKVKTNNFIDGSSSIDLVGVDKQPFQVNGFFIGPSAKLDQSLLERVLKSDKKGVLQTPSIGAINAICTEYRFSSNKEELGRIDFTAHFIESKDEYTNSIKSNVDKFKNAYFEFHQKFLDAYSAFEQNIYSIKDTVDILFTIQKALRSENGMMRVKVLKDQVTNIVNGTMSDLSALATEPEQIRDELVEVFSSSDDHIGKASIISQAEAASNGEQSNLIVILLKFDLVNTLLQKGKEMEAKKQIETIIPNLSSPFIISSLKAITNSNQDTFSRVLGQKTLFDHVNENGSLKGFEWRSHNA